MAIKPVVLMILDGWGLRGKAKDNAVTLANPVNFYRLQNRYPSTCLKCSGLHVGLPQELMGNSEVGHLNIGSGRIVYQEITRISNAIKDGSLFDNIEINAAIDYAQKNNGNMHLMGLLSDGGVHSHLEHLYALLALCRDKGLAHVYVHAFLDGRDVNPKSAGEYVIALEKEMKRLGIGQIASLSGRYYAMDRDNHWDRIARAYDAMVNGEGLKAANPYAAIENSYQARVTDEFVEPVVIVDDRGNPLTTIKDGDGIIFFNFRADRARQITRAFTEPVMNNFERKIWPQTYFVCMTQYDATIKAPAAFHPQNLDKTLGAILAEYHKRQLRIAETEKYAHVTFFFNGGVEEPNPGEDRVLIPSPNVATYNLQPEMSARELTARVLEEIRKDFYDVIIINFANPDMVGHTGVLDAAVKAVKTVDECMAQIVGEVLDRQGCVLITADHGNCEVMLCPQTGSPHTAHTTEKVPFILVGDKFIGQRLREDASLRDIAPTILNLLDIPVPEEMTGKPLIELCQS
ncbi:MAG: 2,3-bisphosphoglycerate-independent phosphoglycerate mutase [Syntrophomonadaceae bacterium]|jgi:2,3-bisphosphoglycerate-independent phosphoglycerate mutase